eukprot:COSAG06_NODE_47022_length_342_cov_1.065844_1_plen_42_part_10
MRAARPGRRMHTAWQEWLVATRQPAAPVALREPPAVPVQPVA